MGCHTRKRYRMTFTEYPQIEQGSEEWFEQRRGIVTASIVGHLITQRTLSAKDYECPTCQAPANAACVSKRTGDSIKTMHTERAAVARSGSSTPVLEPASNDTSRGILLGLAGERFSGFTDDTPMTAAMYRGVFDEPIARDVYRTQFAKVRETGFMVRDFGDFKLGYSPDGVVGDDGLIEVKSRSQRSHVRNVLTGEVPAENMAQLQCGLLVSGRKWIDYIDYTAGMHMWVRRVYPNPAWQQVIVQAVRQAEQNIQEIVRRYAEAVEGFPLTERILETFDQEIVL